MHLSRHGDSSAPTLLLVHGRMLTGSMWEQQVEAFSSTHSVLVPDLPGHGQSIDENAVSFAETADQLAAELRGRRDVTAVGYSIGGQIVLSMLARHPGLVRSAVVVSALTREVPEPSWRRLAPQSLNVPLQRRSVDAFSEERKAFRLPTGLASSGARALVAGGDREQREVVVSVAETAAAFERGQALVVPGTGLDWIVHRPEQFNQTVSAWLAGDPVSVETAL